GNKETSKTVHLPKLPRRPSMFSNLKRSRSDGQKSVDFLLAFRGSKQHLLVRKGVEAMKSTYGLTGLTLLAVSAGLWGAASYAQQEPPPDAVAAKAGETLDEVGRAIKRGLVDAEESLRDGLNKTGVTVREGFAKTRDSVQGMGL